MHHIGIIGGGAWGTALAASAVRAGRKVTLWALEDEVVSAVNIRHENTLYLPGIPLDPALRATGDMAEAAAADAILLVAPAQHMRAVAGQLVDAGADAPLVICSKGVEQKTLALMSDVLSDVAPGADIAVLSGPTFAAELARNLPTAVTLAARDEALGGRLIEALGHNRFRPYLSHDVVGAQIGGAVKNVLAIAAGIVAGARLGDNAAAALITRGLAEIMRLGQALGAQRETLMGLSGLGDLVLTCGSTQSRNMSLGKALGEGRALAEILGERRSVAEGVFTASGVAALADRHEIEMPICGAMDRVLNHGAVVTDEIDALLSRPFKLETL
ncbi:NAD(P)H-dependent glycerol-3-phosphate dehydrogenase [Iodidimonas sp. SYSU 1G8]|uniref:NAD(P)H-dependent glycerol-3-phosphate dehydrogenase n=1 Tax=Iodidimonas sp. SYSU 1G8 TaxID=3133967 RepID=UPI0031FE73CD